jgi:mono/diheme cytochrome c family protein
MGSGFLFLALAGLALFPLYGRPLSGQVSQPQEKTQERVEYGRRTFAAHCASCHGRAGQGDGPVAPDLKVPPADLTRLTARNNGQFPRDRAYMAIDGRTEIRGHGSSEMPVWGLTFQVRESDRNQEQEVRDRILDLLAFLRSIQK